MKLSRVLFPQPLNQTDFIYLNTFTLGNEKKLTLLHPFFSY